MPIQDTLCDDLPAVGIHLARWKLLPGNGVTKYGFTRRRYQVMDAVGMPTEIFLFEQTTRDPFKGIVGETFIGVASKIDLNEYPVGAPDDDNPYPFFRRAAVDIEFPSEQLANEAYLRIIQRITKLIEAVKYGACLVADDEIIIGDDPGVT